MSSNRMIIHAGPRGIERIILRLPKDPKSLGLLDFIAPELYRLQRALIACGALEDYKPQTPGDKRKEGANAN